MASRRGRSNLRERRKRNASERASVWHVNTALYLRTNWGARRIIRIHYRHLGLHNIEINNNNSKDNAKHTNKNTRNQKNNNNDINKSNNNANNIPPESG